MRNVLVIIVGLALLMLPSFAMAGVLGSAHDLSAGADELCFACHVPHNALGSTLWASTPSGTFTGVQDLCYTCHDGSPTSIGSGTVFDPLKEQHLAVGADCSGASACHDVHNQNPNTTGRFLVTTAPLVNGSYCEACHDATQFTGAEALGDHTAGITHYTNGTTFTCNQCHTIHGATAQTTNPAGLTRPILLADNTSGGYYGAFCISCHNGTAPTPAAVGSGGVAASDVFNYSEATTGGTEYKHPTITTGGGTPVGGCNKCHDVHDPVGTDTEYLLTADNANSAFCTSCHTTAGAPQVGANTHFTGIPASVTMNNGLTPALPWADQIDEDGSAGQDYGNATANTMACESCHSVHREGLATGSRYFLRRAMGNLNELCSDCHTDN